MYTVVLFCCYKKCVSNTWHIFIHKKFSPTIFLFSRTLLTCNSLKTRNILAQEKPRSKRFLIIWNQTFSRPQSCLLQSPSNFLWLACSLWIEKKCTNVAQFSWCCWQNKIFYQRGKKGVVLLHQYMYCTDKSKFQ